MHLVKIVSEGCHHDSGYMLSELDDVHETVFYAAKLGSEPSFEDVIPANRDTIIRQALLQDSVPLFGNPEYPLEFRLELGSHPNFRQHYASTHNLQDQPGQVDYQMGFHRYSLSVFDLLTDKDAKKLVDDNQLVSYGFLKFIPGDSVTE